MEKQSFHTDIEIYPNLFLLVAKNIVTKEYRVFQISPIQDDRHKLIDFIRDEVEMFIGFNFLQYDYPLLDYFFRLYPLNLTGRELVTRLKAKSNELINQEQGYKNIIKNPLRKIRDLFKIRHYDNKAKATSLKLLAFNLRMINVQELPFEHTTLLTNDEITTVVEYCHNDVDVTEKVDEVTQEDIQLREQLGKLYGMDMSNFSDGKIGEQIFIKILKQKLGLEHIGKTPRSSICLGNIVFDYVVFQSREFTMLLEWFKGKTISETKGTFNEISFEDLTSLEGMYNRKVKKGCQDGLNIVYKGFRYDFGVGGIHGSIKPGVYQSDNEYAILDIDGTSYYPKLGIENWVYPEHLGRNFCIVYEEIFQMRQSFPKKSAPNVGLKYALNVPYGKSNSPHSPLYDPQYTMTITINGQLLLCMLAERIVDEIEDVTLLQMNTDGLTIKIRRDKLDEVHTIMKRWEIRTKIKLEEAEYNMMVIRDVNNYSARFLDGTIKRKGTAFMYKVSNTELELHKNHSMLVVPMAVEKYFYEGIQPEDYIPEHKDTYDFFKRVKLPKKFSLQMSTLKEEIIIKRTKKGKELQRKIVHVIPEYKLQNITRYYVAKEGYTITKIMPPAPKGKSLDDLIEIGVEDGNIIYELRKNIPELLKQFNENRQSIIEVGYICIDCNDLRNVDLQELRKNINYQYYIDKARKVIEAIEGNGELDNEEENEE